MNRNTYLTFLDSVMTSTLDGINALKHVSNEIYESSKDSVTVISGLFPIIDGCAKAISSHSEFITITDELDLKDVANLFTILSQQDKKVLSLGGIDNAAWDFTIDDTSNAEEQSLQVQCDDENITIATAIYDSSSQISEVRCYPVSKLSKTVRGVVKETTLLKLLNDNAKGSGATVSIGSLCDNFAQTFASYANDPDLSGKLSEVLLSFKSSLPSNLFQAIHNAIPAGAESILKAVHSYTSVCKDAYVSSEQRAEFSTSVIEFNTFAPGPILSSIGGIITTIGLAIAGVSKLIGIIVAALGVITKFIGSAISNFAQTIAGTKFTYRVGGGNYFDFSIGQYSMVHGSALGLKYSTYLQALGVASTTISFDSLPLVYLIFYETPEEPDTSNINIEIHYSTNFDLFPHLTYDFVDSSDTNGHYRINTITDGVLYPEPIFLTSGDCIVTSPNHFTKYENNFLIDYGSLGSNYGECVMVVCSIIKNCLKPMSISRFQQLESVFSGEMNSTCWSRLASAALLTALYFEVACFMDCLQSSGVYLDDIIIDEIGPISLVHFINESEIDDFEPQDVYALASFSRRILCSEYSEPRKVWDYPDQDTSHNDGILNGIKSAYDGLPYSHVYEWDISSTGNRDDYVFVERTEAGSGSYMSDRYSFLPNMKPGFVNKTRLYGHKAMRLFCNPCIFSEGVRDPDWPTSVTSWTYYAFSDAAGYYNTGIFNPHAAVNLPSTLFSAFVAGIIVDAIVGITALIVTAIAVAGTIHLLNKRAQKQAQTEALWYDYQDKLLENGASAAETKDAWKAYKTSRLKYNILAVASGGTTLGLGLYDEGSIDASESEDETDVVSTVANINNTLIGPDGEVPEDPLTSKINDVLHSITGQ